MTRQQQGVFAVGLAVLFLALGTERTYSIMTDSKTVTVTDKEKNTKVTLAPDDLLVVRLEAPMGEGFQWQITQNNKDQLKSVKAPPDKLGKSPPSKVELQVFYFKAITAGTSDLELEYKRSADKDAKPVKTYKITVQIDK